MKKQRKKHSLGANTLQCVPTSAIPFKETDHCRLRRQQRGIDKKDLQAALKHRYRKEYWRQKNGDRSFKCYYKDIVYIVNARTGEAITTYAQPLQLKNVPVQEDMLKQHKMACRKLQEDLESWTSNTVLVVDTSGSIKQSDIWGAPLHLQAVWISLALDFVAHRLESGTACCTDIVSIVALAEDPIVLLHEAPCTWVLYNQLVDTYRKESFPPYGHGPFVPALNEAERLFTRNPNAACAMALLFLSDGKPSDQGFDHRQQIVKTAENIARRFGKRLTFTAIGVGDEKSHTRTTAEFSMKWWQLC